MKMIKTDSRRACPPITHTPTKKPRRFVSKVFIIVYVKSGPGTIAPLNATTNDNEKMMRRLVIF
jgi:hypothetical protein